MATSTMYIAQRPIEIDGCVASWAEKQEESTLRTQMESGLVKVRRRYTGVVNKISAGITIKATQLKYWKDWYNINCATGIYPTRIKDPSGKEIVVRFTQPFTLRYVTKDAVDISMELEVMPGWEKL